MTDRLLSKLIGDKSSEGDPELEEVRDFGCFGWLRGIHDRALMVELRKKTGIIEAVSYALLERATYDPSDGITLYAASRKIKIIGRNLGPTSPSQVGLFNGIVRHRVPWIAETPKGSALLAKEDAVIVDAIQC